MKKEVYEISSKTKISNELARHEIPLIELSDLQKDMFMYLCIKAVENVEQKERNFKITNSKNPAKNPDRHHNNLNKHTKA